jgi:GNAT superfamily N-acetyltransferase
VISIREASEEDLPAILRILAESGIDDGNSFSLPEARDEFARLRADGGFRLFVALAAGEIVGTYAFFILGKLGKRGRPAAIVEDVAVSPSHQGQGIGRAMMEHALERAREANCYKLALSSNLKRTDAHRFYESLGFARHGYSFAVFL